MPDGGGSPGVRRSLTIIAALAQGRQSFAELRRLLGDVAAPTLSRLLKVLQEEGWVEAVDGGYGVGPAARTAGAVIAGGADPVAQRAEAVRILAQTTRESAAWVRWTGSGIVFELKHEMPDSYHFMAVGRSNDAPDNGFVATALLATGTAAERRALCAAGSHEHCDKGRRVVAPVWQGNDLIGLVGITAPPRRFSTTEGKRIHDAVREAATTISSTFEA